MPPEAVVPYGRTILDLVPKQTDKLPLEANSIISEQGRHREGELVQTTSEGKAAEKPSQLRARMTGGLQSSDRTIKDGQRDSLE